MRKERVLVTRKALLIVLTVAVFLPACTALQTLGRSGAEAEPSSLKAETLAPTSPPAAQVVAALPARSEKAGAKQEAEEAEGGGEDAEGNEDAEEGATDAEESEEAEGGASSQEIGVQPVPVPSAGMMEGAPVPSAGPGTRLGVAGRAAPAQPEAPQYVSLNFDNADLELVLRSIADITRINFIIGPGVKANITMRTTTRVPSSEVLSIMESVLEVNNLAAVKEGSYYKIVPIAVAQQEPQDVQVGKERVEERERYSTQVVQLDYLSADETSKIVQSLIGKGARMIVHKETNSMIIAGFNSTLKRILETIKALDVPTKRDNIQRIFVYFVENAKAAELANTLNTLYGRRDLVRGAAPGTRPGQTPARPGMSGPSTTTAPPPPAPGAPPPAAAAPPPGAEAAPGEVVGEVTIVSDEATNSLIIKTSPRNYEIVEATIKQLDIIPKQVLIELMLAGITLDDSFKFSLEEIIRSGQFLITGAYGVAPLATAISGVVQQGVAPATGLTLAFVDKDKFRVVLNNLVKVSKAEVLASPHLLTANNKEAAIQIGSEVPIPTGVQTLGTTSSNETGTSSNLFSTFQRKDIGIILKIKPHVNEKRLVALDIETENLSISSEAVAAEGGDSFSKVTTKTAVVVQDGQSLLIAGIIRTDKSKGYSGIPFLSSIPLIGYLFRGTSDSFRREELIILITPHVIGTPEEGRVMSEQFRSRVESLEKLMQSSPTTSPSGLAPKLSDEEKGDPR